MKLKLCLIGLLSLPLLWNLLRSGFYASHDGEWMVIRLTAFHQEFRASQFPIRWLSRLNHNYGYPVTNFLYPLPFYFAEPFYIITQNPVVAIKFVFILSILLAAIGQWLLLKKLGNIPALAGTLIYIYSPYFAYNIYQRGSVGETLAMGIAPWVFWFLSEKKLLLFCLSLAALILSHNVVAVLFFPIILIYLAYVIARSPATAGRRGNLKFLILALGLSAFFWLPALGEYRLVRASIISVSDFDHEYLTVKQAFLRSGPITTIFSGGLSVAMLTNISQPIWDLFKSFQIIQFPWRLLSVFSFTSSIFLSYLIQYIYHHSKTIAIGFFTGLIAVTFVYTKDYLSPASFNNHLPSYYQTNDDSTTSRAEYTPIWVNILPSQAPDTPRIHYYPGLKIFINGKSALPQNPYLSQGLLVPVQQLSPTDEIRIIWSETLPRTAANLASAFSALILLYLKQYNRRYAA